MSEAELHREKLKANKLDSVFLKFVFTNIFNSKMWLIPNQTESVSGIGSSVKSTETIRKAIPELLKKYDIKTVLDIPCGDFNWMRLLDLSNITYTGGDIVQDLISLNQNKYGKAGFDFQYMDIVSDSLPEVDLIISRDCFVHFSFRHIFSALENIVSSRSKYLLATTFYQFESNFDIQSGFWRPLNLQKPPFNLCQPLELILENCNEGKNRKYSDKSLGLWKISDF